MDNSTISAASSLVTSLSGDNSAGVYALKKALKLQEESAVQLINSLPRPAKPADPGATLGRNIDTRA